MSQVARLEGKLTLNDVEFNNALNRAEKNAQTFAGRSQAFLTQAFKRSPNMRMERALSGAFQSLATGDIGGAIEGITHRMTGLGLGVALGVGAGVAIFAKFKGEIDETRKAGEALHSELRRPLSITTGLSNEGMERVLETRQKLVENLMEKSSHKFGSELSEAFQSVLTGTDLGFGGAEKSGQERLELERQITKENEQRKAINEKMAERAGTMLAIKKEEIDGDEHAARIEKLILDTQMQQAALKAKGLTHAAYEKASTALDENLTFDIKQEDKRAAGKQRSLDLEEKIAKLQREKGITSDQRKMLQIGAELKVIDEQTKDETNPVTLQALRIKRLEKENELKPFYKPEPKNPFAAGTIANRNFEESQGGFGTLAGRAKEMNDASAFGTLGANAANRGDVELPKAQENASAAVVGAIKELTDLMAKAFA